MSKLKLTNEWWTAPAQSEDGQLIMVTGRRDMTQAIELGVYVYRMEVTWAYDSLPNGLPDEATSRMMGAMTDVLLEEFNRDPVAILTGIFTGAGERNWIFYTRSLHIFQRKLNELLAPFDALPLTFYAEEDAQWNAYREMCETEISVD